MITAYKFIGEGKSLLEKRDRSDRSWGTRSDVLRGILSFTESSGALDRFVMDKQESSLELVERVPLKVRDLFL